MDTYATFADLKQHEIEGQDYTILFRDLSSNLIIMAPHGGGIEPGTVDIADAMAGGDYSFYAFKGIKRSGNRTLHISSDRFDEPAAMAAVQRAEIVITVHGAKDKSARAYVGGTHDSLKSLILGRLTASGFPAGMSERPGLRGIHPENICNRGKAEKGVQLELSRGLRETLFGNLDHRSLRYKTVMFYQFVETLREALKLFP